MERMKYSCAPRHLALATAAATVLLLSACSTIEPPQKPWAECTLPSQLDTETKVLYRSQPRIRAHWFPDGLRTRVVYQFEVTPEGKMGRKFHEPADVDPRIISAIEQSFQYWRFKPATRNGQPVTTCFEQPYELVFESQRQRNPFLEMQAGQD